MQRFGVTSDSTNQSTAFSLSTNLYFTLVFATGSGTSSTMFADCLELTRRR